jgi:hypothetical protein
MKNTIKLVTIIIASAIISSCGGDDDDMKYASPKEVFTVFAARLIKSDFDGAIELATKESAFVLNYMKTRIEENKASGQVTTESAIEKFRNIDIHEAEINGDVGTVPITDKEGNQIDVPMKKENGRWKVDLNMEAVRGMVKKKKGQAIPAPHSTNQ